MTALEKEIQSALGNALADNGVQVFLRERNDVKLKKYMVYTVSSEGDVIYANNTPIIQSVSIDVNYYAPEQEYDENDITATVAAMKLIGYSLSSDITAIFEQTLERAGVAMEFSREQVV